MQEENRGENLFLVVEDELDDFILLEQALRRAGVKAHVRWVETGAEALDALATIEPGTKNICVVSDIRLPGSDGFELLEQLKSQPPSAQMRFAFLTSHCDNSTEQRALAKGANAFFVKPVGFNGLIEIAAKLEKLLHSLEPSGPEPER
jgi:two-component system, response regulator